MMGMGPARTPAGSGRIGDTGGSESMMTLYQFESCPYCKMVRQKLSDLEMTYVSVCVPRDQSQRGEVLRVSGQPTVPVLVDGDVVLTDENDILHYLERNYVLGGQRK